MKRANHLMEKICELDNLYLAYYKANKGKMFDADAIKYRGNLHTNISLLQEQLLSDRVSVGNYHYFTIHDPKVRVICAADFSERVLFHALMNVCHDYFEKQLIFDTYATRIDKGIYAALDRAGKVMKKYQYVIKLDVRKYFDSISHEKLMKKLHHVFKEKKLLDIFEQIIISYQTKPKRGIPIGNLTSQYFANYYLSELDHFAKEDLKIRYYYRYMDDILFFGNDKSEIQSQISRLTEKASSDFLSFKPAIFVPCSQGINFLGYKLYPYKIKLNSASKKRFKNKLELINRQLNNNCCSESDIQSRVTSLLAFAKHAYTKRMRSTKINSMKIAPKKTGTIAKKGLDA